MKNILPQKYQTNCSNKNSNGTIITKIKETKNGYTISLFSHYICITTVKLIYNELGFITEKRKVEKNYQPIQNYTYYYDNLGNEIKDSSNSTKIEKKIWNNMQKDLFNKHN